MVKRSRETSEMADDIYSRAYCLHVIEIDVMAYVSDRITLCQNRLYTTFGWHYRVIQKTERKVLHDRLKNGFTRSNNIAD